MAKQEFASLHTGYGKSGTGLHYFRKSSVNYCGIAEHRHEKGDPYFRVKITYATSGSTNDTFVLDMENDIAFKEFIDQMLDTQAARTEELATIRNGLSHMGAPEEPRHTLKITEGVTALYHWLRDAKNQPANWEVNCKQNFS